jgi:hypothetical protein
MPGKRQLTAPRLQPRLDKAAFKDVEPPHRAGLRVVGRAFAEVTADRAEDSGGYLSPRILSRCGADRAGTRQRRD